jgi:hypothetical protein
MNRLAACATFVATIGATLALAGTGAFAAKPAPPPPPNPCIGADSRGFPAMVFTRQRTTGGRIYYDTILADASGQCQQTIYVADGLSAPRPSSDVNLRYDAVTGNGLVVRGGGAPGLTIAASRYTVTFGASGVPLVLSGSYSTILALADLQIPVELDGWSKYVIANPLISPDGTKMLATVAFRQVQGTVVTVRSTFWTCPFDSLQQPPTVATSCQMVYPGAAGNSSPSAGWSGGSDSIYITDALTNGSGRALYRLQLATQTTLQTLSVIWSQGSLFYGVRGGPASANRELVAVYEAVPSTGCHRIWVIDANQCGGGACTDLNGAVRPARTMTWLPDGGLAGEGQTTPNRKGQCFAAGSIIKFDADDPNATTTTTVTPNGSYPDGAGGG